MKAFRFLRCLLLFLGNTAPAFSQSGSAHLRGAMIPARATARDLRDLAALGANHVRWQLTWNSFPQSPADTASPEAYRLWLRETIWHVKSLLPLCDSLGLQVLIDLHTLPGGMSREGEKHLGHRMFWEPAFAETFRQCWEEIPLAFRHEKAVWGYDLANEPEEGEAPLRWTQLWPRIAEQLRALDPHKKIVVEGSPSGSPEALASLLAVAQPAGIVYSFHMYHPSAFTHQGIYSYPAGISYPGTVEGRYWDSATLRQTLQPVRDWQLRNGQTEIYVGEFSAIRWAPDGSAYRYLRDCIALFEEWDWSWAYHAWREWEGWSVEYGANRNDTLPEETPTDRLLLLQGAFRKNRR